MNLLNLKTRPHMAADPLDFRPLCNHAHLIKYNGEPRLITTNGHILANVAVSLLDGEQQLLNDNPQDVPIPLDALKAATKKPTDPQPIRLGADRYDPVRVNGAEFAPCDNYPHTTDCLNTVTGVDKRPESPHHTVTLDAALLFRLAQAISETSGTLTGGARPVQLEFSDDPNDPIYVRDVKGRTTGDNEGMLMPLRMS